MVFHVYGTKAERYGVSIVKLYSKVRRILLLLSQTSGIFFIYLKLINAFVCLFSW